MNVPLLMQADIVVLGGNTAGLACALSHADRGRNVLLVEQHTCLYREMDRSGCYDVPQTEGDAWMERLFPASCRGTRDTMHPDRLKRHGEALCTAAGVRLLYAAQAICWEQGRLLMAHKSGLYAIACEQVYDCREMDGLWSVGAGVYHLHVLGVSGSLPYSFATDKTIQRSVFAVPEGTNLVLQPGSAGGDHAVLLAPFEQIGLDDKTDWRSSVYQLALDCFACVKRRPGFESMTLARSGVMPVPPEGLDFYAAIEKGIHCPPGISSIPEPNAPFQHPVTFENPLFPHKNAAFQRPNPTTTDKADVIVVGGGTAGAIAALSAARQGMRVLLLEMNERLGGTGTCGGVSIYWFGTRDGATAQVDARVDALYKALDLPRSRCLWNENDVFLPDLKAHALLTLCQEAGVSICFGTTVCAALCEDGAVHGVVYAQGGALHQALAPVTIDATGDADIAMFAGAQHVYGGERNALTYWGSLAQYTTPGNYRNNFSTMVHVGDPLDYTRFITEGRRRGEGTYDHGGYVALRESRHIRSLQDVTLDKLLLQNEPSDTLYQCFSNYDPKGKLTADVVYAGLLPPNLRMNVPRGAVIAKGPDGAPIAGLLVGGKAMGCTHDAFPGLRMQPDLQQQGFALGVLAAQSVRQGVPAWKASGVREAIAAAGGQAVEQLASAAMDIRQAVSALSGDTPLTWLDMDPVAWVSMVEPVIVCFVAENEVALPTLEEAYAAETGDAARKLLLARLLLWHGSESGLSVILAEINRMLHETNALPRREGSITFGQLLPDHGLMPELVYLLNTLAWAKHTPVHAPFANILTRLTENPRDWRDLRAGIYCYVECFAYIALRNRDAAFIPMLRTLLTLPEFSDAAADPLLAERYAMLRLTLAEALLALGDKQGRDTLEALTRHPVRAIALSAAMALQSETLHPHRIW